MKSNEESSMRETRLYKLSTKLICNNCETRTVCCKSHIGFHNTSNLVGLYTDKFPKANLRYFMRAMVEINKTLIDMDCCTSCEGP